MFTTYLAKKLTFARAGPNWLDTGSLPNVSCGLSTIIL